MRMHSTSVTKRPSVVFNPAQYGVPRSGWQPFGIYKPSLGDVLVRFYDGSLDVLPSRLVRYFVESGGLVEGFRLLPSAFDDRWILFTEGYPNEGAECLILRLSRIDVGRWTNGEFPNRGENAGFDSAWMTLTAAAAEAA